MAMAPSVQWQELTGCGRLRGRGGWFAKKIAAGCNDRATLSDVCNKEAGRW